MTFLALGFLALAPQTQGSDIWERLSFYANGRLRGEATFDNVDGGGNAVSDRYRGRMRGRIGAKYQVKEDLAFEARVSTSSDGNDANNPHWDFGDGDGFNGSGVVMDRFFLDWMATPEVHVRAGKQPHVFARPPIFSDILWDDDVSPAGVTALWRPEANGDASFDARGAVYVATEVGGDEDPRMIGVQGNVYVPVDDIALQLSTSIYDWGNNQDTAVAGNQGNTDITNHFQIWETFVSGTMPGGPLEEVTDFLQFMSNLEESDEDQGWAAGFQLGPEKGAVGTYNVFLVLYNLDADSLFSPVAQDDTAIAGTGLGEGMNGVIFGGKYFWSENVTVKVWVLTSDADAEDDPMRLRFDLDFNIK